MSDSQQLSLFMVVFICFDPFYRSLWPTSNKNAQDLLMPKILYYLKKKRNKKCVLKVKTLLVDAIKVFTLALANSCVVNFKWSLNLDLVDPGGLLPQ